jgi:hypothetical protein
MVQPYDYTLKTPSPGETFFKAVQLGQQQQQVEAQRLQAQAQREKVQAEIDKAAKKVNIFKTLLGPATSMLYIPSKSVVVPFAVSLTIMLTPIRASPFSSVTFPFTV